MIAVDSEDVTTLLDTLDAVPAGPISCAVARLHDEVDQDERFHSPVLVERATLERLVELAAEDGRFDGQAAPGARRDSSGGGRLAMPDRMFLRDLVREHRLPPTVLS